jgi:glutamine cyclotransferase
MDQGVLYKSAGLWDQSRLTATDLSTGQESRQHNLAPFESNN